jgi:hypothetical protein
MRLRKGVGFEGREAALTASVLTRHIHPTDPRGALYLPIVKFLLSASAHESTQHPPALL